MAKAKDTEKATVLKGQEAEDGVLAYLKKMNRPYGAADVCANLKGAIPKSATQKILVSLAEKGEVTQKAYGKMTFFVAKQDQLEDVSSEKLREMEEEVKEVGEVNQGLEADLRLFGAELNKLKKTPTDVDLNAQIGVTEEAIEKCLSHLSPLRAGTPLVSQAQLAQMDTDWTRWRSEWVVRKKVFTTLWYLASDTLPPQDAKEFAEMLGLEYDTAEHECLERSTLCCAKPGKR